MTRSLVVVTLTAFGVANIVSCGDTDLVVDDRTDNDATDQDTDDNLGDTGPLAPPSPQLNIQVYDVTSTTMLIRWLHDAPEGCCTYRVYYSGAQTGPFTFVGEGTDFPRVTGLTPETIYYVYVIAVRDGLESPPSPTRSVLTKPGQATGFRVDRIGGGGVIIAWDTVVGASGFNVYRSAPGATEVTDTSPSVHVGAGTTFAVIDGLESASTYAFRMNVEKGVFRLGDLSDPISATTLGTVTVTTLSPDHGVSAQDVTVTGADFGTVASEVTLIFEGEAGPGDERAVVPSAVTDGSVTVPVPAGAKSGPISVRRFLYPKATSPEPFDVGPVLVLQRLEEGAGVAISSIHTVSTTRALAGRADGTLLRTTQGSDFVAVDYAAAMTGAIDCAGDPGDTGTATSLSSIQCVADDCLVARSDTCNAVRLSDAFDGSPVIVRKRIGPATGAALGPTRLLACGNATNALGCLSLTSTVASTTYAAYTTDFTTTEFAATTVAPPPVSFTCLRGRPGSDAVMTIGTDYVGSWVAPFGNLPASFLTGSASSKSGDCASGAAGHHCAMALGAFGLEQGASSTVATSADFEAVTDVPDATFNDVQCTTYRKCIAVGGIDIGLPTERGVVAQTFDGGHWFYRFVGERDLRVVSCVANRCFIGDRDGGIWRGDAP